MKAITTDIPAGFDPLSAPPVPSGLTAARSGWAHCIQLRLDDDPKAVSHARAHVREILEDWGLAAQADDTLLVVSELVTNAQCPSRGSVGGKCPIRLWVAASSTSLVVLVRDSRANVPQRAEAGPDDERGRGLAIVDALSACWDWYPLPGQGGKVVWALLNTIHSEPSPETSVHEGGSFAFERAGMCELSSLLLTGNCDLSPVPFI